MDTREKWDWRTLFWLCRHGQFNAMWHKDFRFGASVWWYDGPIYLFQCGWFSFDVSA